MRIERASARHLDAWAAMRFALWPDEGADHLAEQAAEWLAAAREDQPNWLAIDAQGEAIGFVEAALRRDYVNGCESSPVAFLEGIYVAPGHRRQGVARALVDTVAAWARSRGISEFASDALVENEVSHAFHARLGFAETERVVYFRRALAA
jgi:aminoglycoside 6'-N-acetyltransferase I